MSFSRTLYTGVHEKGYYKTRSRTLYTGDLINLARFIQVSRTLYTGDLINLARFIQVSRMFETGVSHVIYR